VKEEKISARRVARRVVIKRGEKKKPRGGKKYTAVSLGRGKGKTRPLFRQNGSDAVQENAGKRAGGGDNSVNGWGAGQNRKGKEKEDNVQATQKERGPTMLRLLSIT